MSTRIEYLEAVHKSDIAVRLMLNGAAKIQEGGIETLQLVADKAPDQLLDAIAGLAKVLEMVQNEKLSMIEDHLELLDELDQVKDDLERLANKLEE